MVKFGVNKVKRPIIRNGGSSKYTIQQISRINVICQVPGQHHQILRGHQQQKK